jgi:hypothetical protein
MALSTDIFSFRDKLTDGGARANQFRVTLMSEIADQGTFLCHAASLPGSMIEVTPTMYRGRELKLPGERRFNNWNITIINDSSFDIRNVFEEWMHDINNVEDNSGEIRPYSYVRTLGVDQLDRNDTVLKSYSMIDCWPTNLSDIQLSFRDNNTIEEFTVELAYVHWIPVQTIIAR